MDGPWTVPWTNTVNSSIRVTATSGTISPRIGESRKLMYKTANSKRVCILSGFKVNTCVGIM